MALAKSNTNDLASLFREGFFNIPSYQRRYSWDERQHKDLFSDLLEAFKSKTIHFLGTLSLQLIETRGFSSTYNIIDGQQRFTTLMILYSELAKKINIPEYKAQLKKNDLYFLKPSNKEDSIFFQNILDGTAANPITNSQKLMKEASVFFAKSIYKFSKVEAQNFCDFILNNGHFLIYLVEDLSESIRMFEVINDRGLPLKYFDKIKSFYMYYSNKFLNNSLNRFVEEKFESIYKYFDSDFSYMKVNNDETLLLHHYLSNPDLFPNWSYTKATDNILVDIKKYLLDIPNKENEGNDFIQKHLEDLLLFIKNVESINTKIDTSNKYRDFYIYLSPAQRMYPFSIRLSIKGILEDNISKLEIIEFFLKYRRDPKKDIFTLLKEIINYSGSLSDLNKYINNQIYSIWENQNDAEEILSNTDWAKKFILYKYNKHKNNQDLDIDLFKKCEIEHIFSQSPSFPISDYGFTEESYESFINKIGNLTLLEKQLNGPAGASNKTPHDKIMQDYPDSEVEITKQVNVRSLNDLLVRNEVLVEFANSYLKINYIE